MTLHPLDFPTKGDWFAQKKFRMIKLLSFFCMWNQHKIVPIVDIDTTNRRMHLWIWTQIWQPLTLLVNKHEELVASYRGVNTWAYVQHNQFPGQGDNTNKVFVFRCLRLALGVGLTWLGACSLAGISSMFGSCPTMSNAWPSGPPWFATYTTRPTNASWLLLVATSNLKKMMLKLFFLGEIIEQIS